MRSTVAHACHRHTAPGAPPPPPLLLRAPTIPSRLNSRTSNLPLSPFPAALTPSPVPSRRFRSVFVAFRRFLPLSPPPQKPQPPAKPHVTSPNPLSLTLPASERRLFPARPGPLQSPLMPTRHPTRKLPCQPAPVLLVITLLPSLVSAAWETGWPYRRTVFLDAPPEHPTPDDVVLASIHTAGHHVPSGDIVRVTTDDARPVPARFLMAGPGDTITVAFALRPPALRYHIYFGNPNAPAPRPADRLALRSGVLLEIRKPRNNRVGPIDRIEDHFSAANTTLGQTLIPRLYIGVNPFGEQTDILCKYSATLRAPVDGSYAFAASATDRGALFLNGKQLLVAENAHDTRYNAKIDLRKGTHELVFYQRSPSGRNRLSVAWKQPASDSFEIIPSEAFGRITVASPGPLEQKDKSLTADFKIEYLGECFFADHYSHRYRFTAQKPPSSALANPKFEWDFGNGQTASGPVAEQVYFSDALYPVKLTARLGAQTDTQTTRLSVSRCYEKLDNPPTDTLAAHAAVAAAADVTKMPPLPLAFATILYARTKTSPALEKSAARLASLSIAQSDINIALSALQEASDVLLRQNKLQPAINLWNAVPADSALQPRAAIELGQILLWRTADFPSAVKTLESQANQHRADHALQRLYAQALLLDQKTAEARKILLSLPPKGPLDRQAALSGALARTIEYYIAEKDPLSGQQAWEQWQQQYPADFLEGYSLFLQTRLIELNDAPVAAARVAEAFATALPKSSYSPRLLDRASRLLEKSDPKKSNALRDLLKQKYPEDPLSQ